MVKKPSKTPTKPNPKARKRGPKEERLIITGDPAVALAMLLNTKKPKKS